MLLTRVLSALILLPIVLGVIWIGGCPFDSLLSLLLCLSAIEFCHLMQRGGFRPPVFFSIVLILSFVIDAMQPEAQLLQPAIAAGLLGSLTWQLFHRQGVPAVDWALAIAGGLYLGIAGASGAALRQLPHGERWLLLVLTGTWLADSGAYFVGSRLGRHKMTPTLSPRKSWEGLIGGIIFGIGLNPIVAGWFGLPPIHGAVLGAFGATLGVLGDLAISMVKRQVGAKDSGRLIPGHGGALDRLDSILFTLIVGYYYVAWFALTRPF